MEMRRSGLRVSVTMSTEERQRTDKLENFDATHLKMFLWPVRKEEMRGEDWIQETNFYQRQRRSYWLREQRDMSNYAPLGKLILLLHLNITSAAPVAVHGTTAFITGWRNFYINKTTKNLENPIKSL